MKYFFLVLLLQAMLIGAPKSLKFEAAFPHLKFERPLAFLIHPENTKVAYVVEQFGKIWHFEKSKSAKRKTLVLDISERLGKMNEEGLLSMVFDPDFKSQAYVYLYYSAKKPRRSVISRFLVDDKGRIGVKSEFIIMEIPQPYWNHNGGQLAFGADGYLYVGLGDGGSGGDPKKNGQDLSTVLGSIIRIDVNKKENGRNYSIPPSNPFVNKKGARAEIFAYGLRNPWRFSFDTQTNEMICADVGQNKQEEVDLIVGGGNYGWRVREGKLPFKEQEAADKHFIEPLVTISRKDGRSITGGYVYRGKKIRALTGWYIYCDFITNNFYGLKQRAGRVEQTTSFGKYNYGVSSFAVDEQGEMYICSFTKNGIYKIIGTR